MGGFRAWLAILGLLSLATVLYGLSLLGKTHTQGFGAGIVGAGLASAVWCFGVSSVVAALQRIEAKLGTTPEEKPKATPKSPPAPASPNSPA